MGQLIYPILRGALIHPAAKDGSDGNASIDYYLCLITLPTLPNGAQPQIVANYPTSSDDSGIIQYTYSGIMPTGFEGPTSDYLLPIYANQMVTNVTQVQVTDSAGNYVRGNPNGKIPPIAPIKVDSNSNYKPTNIIINGLYNPSNYFVVVMLHSASGYTNSFLNIEKNNDGTRLKCYLKEDATILTGRAVIGAFATPLDTNLKYSWVVLNDTETHRGTASDPMEHHNWSNPIQL